MSITETGTGTIPTTGTWRIDSVHSTVGFRVAHWAVATFRGGFRDVAGALRDGVLEGSVATESLELPGPAVFKEHLLAADWFDGAQHAELSFRSRDLHSHGEHVHGTGELTIKGVSKPVELHGSVRGPVEVTQGDSSSQRLGIDLQATIDRREFGVTGDGDAGWTVTIEVALELVNP